MRDYERGEIRVGKVKYRKMTEAEVEAAKKRLVEMLDDLEKFDPDDPEDVKRILMLESGNYVPFIRTSLPRVYTSAAHTPLSCEVPSAEELTFDLDSSLAKKKRDRSK